MPPVIREDGAHPMDDQTLETLQDAVLEAKRVETLDQVKQETKRLNSLEDVDKKKNHNESTYYEIHVQDSVTSDSSSISSNSSCTTTSSSSSSSEEESGEGREPGHGREVHGQDLVNRTSNVQSQFLREKVKVLQSMVREKDEELSQFKAQLRRATTSKCDLVVAVRDIERQKHMAEDRLEEEKKIALGEKRALLEQKATHEAELMNEIAELSAQVLDMRRMHQNQLLEKDFVIAQLQEQVRRLKENRIKTEHQIQLSL